MEFRHLRYFVTVAEDEHITRAAQRLHISESPLSRQIRQMEEELGVQLFDRGGKRVRLSRAGAQLLDRARDLLDRLEHFRLDARRLGQGEAGQIDIGYVPHTIHASSLGPILRDLSLRYPSIHPRLHPLLSGPQIDALILGQLDLAIVYSPVEAKSVKARKLLDDPYVLLVSENHPLAGMTEVGVAKLKNESWVTSPEQSRRLGVHREADLRDMLIDQCHRAGFEPHIAYETLDVLTALTLVATGEAVSLAPRSVASLTRGVVPIAAPFIKRKLSLMVAWRPESLSPAASTLLNLLFQQGSQQDHR